MVGIKITWSCKPDPTNPSTDHFHHHAQEITMTLNVLVKGIKKVERKMLVLLTTEMVGKYCESLFQSYLLAK